MSIKESEQLLRKHIPVLLSLWRGGGGAGPLTQKELARTASAVLSLQRGLTGERGAAGMGYMNEMNTLGAYLLYYWPISYLQFSLSLSVRPDIIQTLSHKRPLRILDLGCGPGPASAALADLVGKRELEITFVDYSAKAMKLATKLLASSHIKTRSICLDLMHDDLTPIKGMYDIILIGHTLNELWLKDADAVAKRTQFLLRLSAFLAPDGFLFILDPALLKTSRDLIEVRNNLVDSGFNVYSPCMCTSTCPVIKAGEGHTCHAEVRWRPIEPVASLAEAAGLDRESVKMTFFLFSRAKDVPDDMAGDPIYARVVSDGMLNKSGRVRFLLCDGKKRFPLSAKKDDEVAKAAHFFFLKRYDRIEVLDAEVRGSADETAYGVGKDTKITLLERL